MENPTIRKPSEELVWRKHYAVEEGSVEIPHSTMYRYLHERFEDKKCDPSSPAIHYYGTTLSYSQFFDKIDRAADCFTALGVKQGDKVVFLTVNLPETFAAFYALNKIGAIPVLVEPRMGRERIRLFMEMVHAKTLILLDIVYPKVADIISDLRIEHVIVQHATDSLPKIKGFLRKIQTKAPRIPYGQVYIHNSDFEALYGRSKAVEVAYEPGSVCAISQTGGTTGVPKGVMLTNDGLNCLALTEGFIHRKVGELNVMLNIMPLFTSYGVVCGLHAPLCNGLKDVLVPDFKPENFPALVHKYRPNITIAVPTFFEHWLSHPELENDDMSYLRMAISGGDYMQPDLERRLNRFIQQRGAPNPMAQGYGLSEASAAAAFTFSDIHKEGSVGVPLYTTVMGIFKPGTDEELGYNESGEICVSGPSIMKGYYNNPEETANVLRTHSDGKVWLHTGDLGKLDEDGFLFFTGRSKYVIPRFDGHKLFPSQIEDVVTRLKEVNDACVIGIKDLDHSHGHLPLVVVEKAPGTTLPEAILTRKIFALCKDILEERGQPCGVVYCEKIPQTLIGKKDRSALEQQFAGYDYRKN